MRRNLEKGDSKFFQGEGGGRENKYTNIRSTNFISWTNKAYNTINILGILQRN